MRFPRHDRRFIFLVIGSGLLISIIVLAAYGASRISAGRAVDSVSITNSSVSFAASSTFSHSTSNADYDSTSSSSIVVSQDTSDNSGSQNFRPEPRTGVIVPIFTENTESQLSEVEEVIQTKLAYQSVPIIAVINPSGGPGTYSPSIFSEIQNMQAANVTVLGYVPTNWGTRNISSVEADISTYHEWYRVNGTYLDQMPNWEYDGPQGQWYYPGPDGTYIPSYFSALTHYAKSLGETFVFGNSGADVPHNFIGTVSTIGIFENGFEPPFFGFPSLAGNDSWHTSQSKSNFAFFSYRISSLNPYYVATASDYVAYMFLTNDSSTDSYTVLPPYFDQLARILASEVSINIGSDILNDPQISAGFAITVTQPDGTSNWGYAPFTFETLAGSDVTITAESFVGYVFSHWSNGSTNPTISVNATQSMNLISYYNPSFT